MRCSLTEERQEDSEVKRRKEVEKNFANRPRRLTMLMTDPWAIWCKISKKKLKFAFINFYNNFNWSPCIASSRSRNWTAEPNKVSRSRLLCKREHFILSYLFVFFFLFLLRIERRSPNLDVWRRHRESTLDCWLQSTKFSVQSWLGAALINQMFTRECFNLFHDSLPLSLVFYANCVINKF